MSQHPVNYIENGFLYRNFSESTRHAYSFKTHVNYMFNAFLQIVVFQSIMNLNDFLNQISGSIFFPEHKDSLYKSSKVTFWKESGLDHASFY